VTAAVLMIAHTSAPLPGRLEAAARANGLVPRVVRPMLGDRLPSGDDGYAGTVVLGGPQSAYDVARHPYLADEIGFLSAAHRAGVPVLGICLGAQLLAAALGGQAVPGDAGLECGFIDVLPSRPEGADAAGRHFSFHTDTFRLPDGAALLASTDKYPQAWRLGNSLALQFHPEFDRADVESVLDIETEKLTRSGADVKLLRKQNAEETRASLDGTRVLGRWMRHRVPGSGPPR